MDFKTQNNQQPPQPQRPATPAAETSKNAPNGRKLITIVVGALVLLALVIAGLMLWQWKVDGKTSGDSGVETGKYQALFMTNGQVYFGKLAKLGGDYSELTDVYYLQVQQPVQPAAENKDAAQQPQVSLTKLGNELHGPTDKMHVSKEQILFWENLKDDSTVVKAIKEYKAKQ